MFIPYTNKNFVFTGIWQENGSGEIVNYKTAAFIKIGFTGSCVEIKGNLSDIFQVFIDDEKASPNPIGNNYNFNISNGRHILKICVRQRNHIAFSGIEISDDAEVFLPQKLPYIHMIGDSITEAYPGYSTILGENLGFDYSIVAQGGLALCDGWGWYQPYSANDTRVGMESNYFKLELPCEASDFTDYTFTYCRQPDIITIFLGTNDFLDNPTDWNNGNFDIFCTRYVTFLAKLRKLYPKAAIYILNALSDKMFRRKSIETAFEKAEECIDNIHFINTDKWNIEISEDGTHPTLSGYADLGNQLTSYFENELKNNIRHII